MFKQTLQLMAKKKFYAVRVGSRTGIYTSWDECKDYVHKYVGAQYKAFETKKEAQAFLLLKGEQPKPKPIEQPLSNKRKMLPLVREGKERKLDDKQPNETIGESEKQQQQPPPPKDSQEKKTVIYTDGACSNNGAGVDVRAGIGVFFGENDKRNLAEAFSRPNPTNQRAEIFAVIRALQMVDDSDDVEIRTDSIYVVNAMTNWIHNWIQNDWKSSATKKDILNTDLFKELYQMMLNRPGKIKFTHVKGHAGISGNVAADNLAVRGAQSFQE